VSYVKSSLDRALARLAEDAPVARLEPLEPAIPASVRNQIYGAAVASVAGLILHEIASGFGLVKRHAAREILEYDNSRTKAHIDRLSVIFAAIEQLKSATAAPRPDQFDLAQLITDVVSVVATEEQVTRVSLVGQRPMLVNTDASLLSLVITNGIRNAVEAIEDTNVCNSSVIVITWGETDVDYWIAVSDSGGGIVGRPEAAFEIGKSTKRGHSGFGLAIAREAIHSLGGTVDLKPSTTGGARYEVRWER